MAKARISPDDDGAQGEAGQGGWVCKMRVKKKRERGILPVPSVSKLEI
tara:strand:+ start:107 stop:250 length:144 start_codon:yes stop_codon:yes gene_type:complete